MELAIAMYIDCFLASAGGAVKNNMVIALEGIGLEESNPCFVKLPL